jgi:hypothetical protein
VKQANERVLAKLISKYRIQFRKGECSIREGRSKRKASPKEFAVYELMLNLSFSDYLHDNGLNGLATIVIEHAKQNGITLSVHPKMKSHQENVGRCVQYLTDAGIDFITF